jgi:hypothetical protein
MQPSNPIPRYCRRKVVMVNPGLPYPGYVHQYARAFMAGGLLVDAHERCKLDDIHLRPSKTV